MVLSGQTIRKLSIFSPFSERRVSKGGCSYGLSACGYDVRIAATVSIGPGEFVLASTLEHFIMPDDVVGIIHDKSTLARMGIAVQNTVAEPGWRGYLTLEITNHSKVPTILVEGEPIAQVVFHRLDEPAENPYDGKYQD